MLGNLIGQACFLLATPVLSRLYSPTAFGIAGAFSAALAIAATASTGRFHLAIPVAEQAGEARSLFRLSVLCTVSIAVPVALLAYLGLAALSDIDLGLRLLGSVWFAVGLILVGLVSTFGAFLSRLDEFVPVGVSKAAQGIGYTGAALALGRFGSYAGLMTAQLVGQAAAAAAVGVGLFVRRQSWQVPVGGPLRNAASKYRSYPLYSSPAGLLNSVSVQAQLLVMPLLFSIEAAGLYALSHRLFIAPAALVAAALSTVYLGSAPQAYRDGNLLEHVHRMVNPMLQIALPVGAATAIVAPLAARFILGEEWAGVGRILQLLAPWFVCSLAIAPLLPTFAVVDRLKVELLFQVSLVVSRVAALSIGALFDDLDVAIALMSLSAVAHYGWLLWWVLRKAGGGSKSVLRLAKTSFLLCTAGAVASVLVAQLLAKPLEDSALALISVGLGAVAIRGISSQRNIVR